MGLVGGMQFNEAGSQLGLSLNTYQSPSDTYTLALSRNPLRHKDLVRWTQSEVGGLDLSLIHI